MRHTCLGQNRLRHTFLLHTRSRQLLLRQNRLRRSCLQQGCLRQPRLGHKRRRHARLDLHRRGVANRLDGLLDRLRSSASLVAEEVEWSGHGKNLRFRRFGPGVRLRPGIAPGFDLGRKAVVLAQGLAGGVV